MTTYCTIQDVRDEGVTTDQAADERLARLIARASAYIDLVTGKTFEPTQTPEGATIETPILIQEAAIKLVIRELPLLGDAAGQEDKRRSRIVSETTDDHDYTLAEAAASGGFTGDPEIDGILAFFQAPPVVTGV